MTGMIATPNITLLTGIPRSGTTLSCSLINKYTDYVALHEPIQPKQILADTTEQMANNVNQHLQHLGQVFYSQREVDNGADSLLVDNPIGDVSKNHLRQVSAIRATVTVEKHKSTQRLFVKQNAMFTALSAALKVDYPMLGIIRNPVDVLISWLSVELPVNKGRLPAGEKIDANLQQQLAAEGSVFARQCIIYQWFISQFRDNKIDFVRYEDILNTQGSVLFEKLNVTANKSADITFRTAHSPSTSALKVLLDHTDEIVALPLEPYYSQREIKQRLDWLASQS